MAYSVKPANIFGRIGTGLGKGLAEQLPKEMERNRLASGLKQLGEQKDLTPFERFAGLASVASDYPQLLQSGERILNQQANANAYRNLSGNRKPNTGQGEGQAGPASPYVPQNQQEAEWMNRIGINQQQGQQPQGPRGKQAFQPGREAPENVNENTFNPSAKTAIPWSQKKMDAEIVNAIDAGILPENAPAYAKDKEARELGLPPVLQQRQKEDQERTATANNELDRQLETKFQKTGEGVYKDLPGEMKINLQREMNKALRTHPDLSIEDAAHEFSKRALSTSKAKGKFDTLAQTTGIEALGKVDSIMNKLKDYSDVFKNSGNSEEYYNMLKRNPDDPRGAGMGFSSEGAASVAFPITPSPNTYIKNYKPQNMKQTKYGEVPDPKRTEANSRKAANDIGRIIGENDSVLTIGRELRKKDPYFDQEAFYDEMRQIKGEIGLNDRQINELPERNTDWLPNWADFLILPWGNTR
jgi:hypothetical protein